MLMEKEFQVFCNQMLEAVKMRFPAEVKVEIHKVLKNNSLELDSLVILEERCGMSPNFYLQYYFEEYKKGSAIEVLAREIEKTYYDSILHAGNIEIDMSAEYCRDKVIIRLISSEQNSELLEMVPHILFLDMAIVFYILIRSDDEGIGSIRVSNRLLEEWGFEIEDLFMLARENTMRLFPRRICAMFSMMDRIMESNEKKVDLSEWEELPEYIPKEPYVITNSNGINGAAVVLYPDTLQVLADFFDEDYFLIPSSIHELLAIPESASIGVEEMYEMVHDVNVSCVALEEILSENVYHYDRVADVIHICER